MVLFATGWEHLNLLMLPLLGFMVVLVLRTSLAPAATTPTAAK
jgi:hypothetical protein